MAVKIRQPRTAQENELQSAIVTSLQVWADRNGVRCTSTNLYANQQGAGLGRLCADFLTTFNDSEILLAEVKVHYDGELVSFNQKQYEDDLDLEESGLPIRYLYNLPPILAYHQKPQPADYYHLTLESINHSTPSLLPHAIPHTEKHENLLDLLKSFQSSGGDEITRFAELFGILRSEQLLTNGLLMLAYGTKKVSIFDDVNAKTLTKVLNMLKHGAAGNHLTPRGQNLLKTFLDEEAQAFSRWSAKKKPVPDPTPPKDNKSGFKFRP